MSRLAAAFAMSAKGELRHYLMKGMRHAVKTWVATSNKRPTQDQIIGLSFSSDMFRLKIV